MGLGRCQRGSSKESENRRKMEKKTFNQNKDMGSQVKSLCIALIVKLERERERGLVS